MSDDAKKGQLVLIYHPHWDQMVSFWCTHLGPPGWIGVSPNSEHQPTHWRPLLRPPD